MDGKAGWLCTADELLDFGEAREEGPAIVGDGKFEMGLEMLVLAVKEGGRVWILCCFALSICLLVPIR